MEELSLHILDIVENSVSAGATLVEIRIEYRFGEKPWLTITVRDNGRGMSPEVAGRVSDPFYTTRTTRKVGLGTALFRQTAELAGGSFRVWSEPGKGTEVTAELNPLHLELVLHAVCDGRELTADTRQFREILGDVPLDTPEVIAFLTEFVRENFAEILRGSPLA